LDKATAALVKLWRENPFHLFTQTEVRQMFNLGEDAMKALAGLGAPIVAKKMNPGHFQQWLWENRDRISKLS
jgi:hypothetical protein